MIFLLFCYCCWNRMIGLATVISVEDVQSDPYSKVIKQWFRIVGYVQHWNARCFDGGWTLLLNCCSQHSLFIVEILIIGKIRIPFHDISKIHICDALSWWTKVKDSTKWLVVSNPLQRVYEFLSRDGYWLSTTHLIVVYRVVGRQGVDYLFDRSHH